MPQPKQDLREIIKQEYKRCAIDPVHFFKKYALIQHPIKGKIPFNLYPFQEDVLSDLKKHRFNIILKSRQMGISTLTAGFGLHQMLFKSDFNVLVIATTQDVAANLVQKVKVMHQNLPVWLRQECLEDNKLSVTFKNGSTIKAVSSSTSSGRSSACSLLIIDECAWVERAHEIWTASQMTLATGGNAILLSSPNGVGNLFHQIWSKAEEGGIEDGLEPFNTIKLKWDLHPERDQIWRDQQTSLLGERQAAQETDCEFLTSGHTVIESDLLQYYDNLTEDPIERRGIGGDLWIWAYPNYQRSYMILGDVARGDGEDYSAFHVLDVESMEQVAEYKGLIDTQTYGNMLVAIATEYNNALLVIDNKNIGWSTIQVALDRGYKNLFYSYKNDPYMDDNIHIRKQYDMVGKEDMVPGFTITTKVRPVLISKMESYLRDKDVRIKSKRLINELYVFKWINGKPEAASGYNDDLVIAFAMGMYIRDTALRMRQHGMNLIRQTLQKTHKSVYKPTATTPSQWKHQVGKNKESLTWLL